MAGLIPQQFIDDLLTRIDIIDVIDGYVPLRKAGRNHIARCPFHDEKTPSFTVSQEKQFYHCFGCGANGTAIGFLMEYAGMDFVEAVEELAGRAGLEVPREGGQPSRDSGVTELYELMEMVVRYYCRQLREHPEAQRAVDYLKERGLTGQLARDFELGFAPAGWDNLVNELGGSDAALQRLAKTGMIIQRENGGYYDRFRDRIMFPIRDQRGRAIGMGGRVLGDGTPKYLNSPETPIFHKGRELYGLYQVRHKQKSIEQLFVVEGYMDVLALSQHGIGNCVATLGTAVTQDHMERLFKVCNLIVFCFDGDSAGQNAAWRALEISLPLIRDSRQVHFLFMPEGDDPDSFVRQHGAGAFKRGNKLALSDYLLNTLKSGLDLNSREDRALLAEKAIPYLARLPAGALLELLLEDLARQCQLTPAVLRQLLREKAPAQRQRIIRRAPGRSTAGSRQANTISQAIRLLLHHPVAGVGQDVPERLYQVTDPGVQFLLELLKFINQQPDITCAGILEHWRDSRYGERLSQLAAMENPLSESELVEEEHIKSEFLDYISKIDTTIRNRQREIERKAVSNLDDLRRLFSKDKDSSDF